VTCSTTAPGAALPTPWWPWPPTCWP
jgi:hypothetical protein